jgi:hypothetical protein
MDVNGKGETRRGRRRGPNRFPGAVGHARILGVSYPHLWQVLSGRRTSRRLVERYRDLTGRDVA